MKIKNILGIFFILTLAALSYGATYRYVYAEDSSIDKEDIEELEGKIEKYENKLSDLKSKEQTLSNEIEIMDGQIELTELRIKNSVAKIAKKTADILKLNNDIKDMGKRIDRLQESIIFQQKVLNARLRERYKSGETSPIIILFGSTTFNQIIQKTEYLRLLELQDKKLLEEMDSTKKAFIRQKELFEDKKEQEERLKVELENEKANLDAYKGTLENQKSEKKRLLEITQNDEAKYRKLLEEAKRELTQITNAVGVLKNQTATKVKKGGLIGVQGNTGYSFGDHLHFGVYKYSSFRDIDGWDWYYSNYVDPAKMLEPKDVTWDTGCEPERVRRIGKGSWDWPLSDPTVSQGFGQTCWSKVYYKGKDHPAFDMYGPYGSPVYAAESGNAYFCRNCLGDGGNGVFIFHESGYMTVYWHLR